MTTNLTLRLSVSIPTIYCLYLLRAFPRECSSYSMANDSLNTTDFSSNRKRMAKVKPEHQERREDSLTRRSIGLTPFFGQTNMSRVCFLRILDRFLSKVLASKCCICLAILLNTGQHHPTMLDDVEMVWMMLKWSYTDNFI